MEARRNRVSEISIPHLNCFHPDLVGKYPKLQSIVIDTILPLALEIMIDESFRISKSPPLLGYPRNLG